MDKDLLHCRHGNDTEPTATIPLQAGPYGDEEAITRGCEVDISGIRTISPSHIENLRNAGIGEPLFTCARRLSPFPDQTDPLTGYIKWKVIGAEFVDEISDGINLLAPRGHYVAVYYQIKNETNHNLSVHRQFRGMTVLVDDRGVRWDHSLRGAEIVAVQKGYEAGGILAAGSEVITAALFDVPRDITGFGLVLPKDRLRVDLSSELSSNP